MRVAPRTVWITWLGGLVLFLSVEAAVFRSGFYARYLEHDSTTGRFEAVFREERTRPLSPREVLVFGDSRIAEGFSGAVANQAVEGSGLHFDNAAVPATSPRSWYYSLRGLDSASRHYYAAVFTVTSYDDEDGENHATNAMDLRSVTGRLRLSDFNDFVMSYPAWKPREQIAWGFFLKGLVYRQDVQAFLENPARRLKQVDEYQRYGREWKDGYTGRGPSLAGLKVDWRTRTVTGPPGVDPERYARETDWMKNPEWPQRGLEEEYRRVWFGRLIAYSRSRGTRVIFVRVPRAPAPRPDALVHTLSHTIRDIAAPPAVTLLDEHAFDNLERPGYFFDDVHMNSAGRNLFSVELAREIRAVTP